MTAQAHHSWGRVSRGVWVHPTEGAMLRNISAQTPTVYEVGVSQLDAL